MKKIIREIKNQPEHIRKTFMWLSVIVVFSFIFIIGIRETERKITALINPELLKEENTTNLADNSSPFNVLGRYFSGLRASIGDVFLIGTRVQEINKEPREFSSPALLPVSGEKPLNIKIEE